MYVDALSDKSHPSNKNIIKMDLFQKGEYFFLFHNLILAKWYNGKCTTISVLCHHSKHSNIQHEMIPWSLININFYSQLLTYLLTLKYITIEMFI